MLWSLANDNLIKLIVVEAVKVNVARNGRQLARDALRWSSAPNTRPDSYETLVLVSIGLRSRAVGLVGFADDWVVSYSIH